MNEIHVIFGTGPHGRCTTEALLEKGLNVRLINRSGKMEAPPKGAEIVKGDATNFSETVSLVQGQLQFINVLSLHITVGVRNSPSFRMLLLNWLNPASQN